MLNMQKNKKLSNNQMSLTVLFGYSLFILTAIGTIGAVAITLTRVLGNPAVQRERIIILFISMALATILPPLISYIVGNRATRSMSRLEHHYNGVLFGIASVWLALILSTSGLSAAIQFWPAIVTTLLMLAVGIGYAKSPKQQVTLLHYKPYQASLLLGIAGMIVLNGWYLASYVTAHLGSLNFGSWEMITGTTVPVQLVILAISYRLSILKKSAWHARLTNASISASIGIIATIVVGQLMIMFTTINTTTLVLLMNAVGICVWIVYMRLIYAKR